MLIASRVIDTHSELSGLSSDDHPQYVHTTIQRTITSSPIFSVNNTSSNSLNIKRIVGQTGKLLNIIAEDNNVLFSIDVDGSITTTSNISGNISGSDITSGLIDPSVLGTGTANSGTFLRGDNAWSNSLSFGTLIANNPFSISQVWNNSGINFEGFVLDCTDTSSGSSSYLMKLKTSGVIVTYVSKSGDLGAVSLSLGSGGITKVSSGLTLDIQNQNSSTANLIQNRFSNATFTQSSGTFIATQISPTLNQSSTAGYTALKIAVTETATGSGTKSLIDCQVGGVVKFNVSNAGIISSSTWNGATIGATYGGTGLSGYTAGDTIYASATNTLAKLSGNNTSTQKVLTMTLNSPQWVDFAIASMADSITLPFLSSSNTFTGIINTFFASGSNATTLVVQAGSNQLTSNLQEWKNNSGTILSKITNSGNIIAPNNIETIAVTFDGQGSVLTAMSGIYRQIHTDGTIVSWTLLADQSGSITIDIKKSTYSGFPTTSSITASATPALSSVQKNTNSTLTGWTTSITSDDILEFAITETPVSITRVVLLLKVKRL